MSAATGMAVRVFEHKRIVGTLGVRFWDFATDQPVDDGLEVTAHAVSDHSSFHGRKPVTALRTPSGVYGFHCLPGLHSVEYPEDASGTASGAAPGPFDFVITVKDNRGWFLPMLFKLTLPLDPSAPFARPDLSSPPGLSSPPSTRPRAYLFSAPTRPPVAGMAAIRADLRKKGTEEPAAHAKMTVEIAGGAKSTGIADERGRVLVPVPYPQLERLGMGSPPGTGQGRMSDQRWPVKISVGWDPSKLERPLANHPQSLSFRNRPSIKSIYQKQGAAQIWQQQDTSQPLQASADVSRDLFHGRPLIAYSTINEPIGNDSTLLVSAFGV
jgi:hypothetical protein